MALGERLSSDAKLKALLTQFVYLKIDVSTPDYSLWIAEHKPERGAIPQVYIVRADGHEIYNQVGAPETPALIKLMADALAESGIKLSENEAKQVTSANELAMSHLQQGDHLGALVALSKIPNAFRDEIVCYASPVIKMREQIGVASEGIHAKIDGMTQLIGDFANLDLSQQIEVVEDYQQLVKHLKQVKPLARALAKLRNVANKQVHMKILHDDLTSLKQSQISSKPLPAEKLDELVARYENTSLWPQVEALLQKAQSMSATAESTGTPSLVESEMRVWTSANGKFTVRARLVAVSDDEVQLVKQDGDQVSVPLNKLSELDLAWLKSVRR
ncbi:MAG TPA: SHD1 domain-containing protein [Pirellulaceae bacterium]|nr:SHD1 domain-containing protein [Pirellulaceae bacterium]HMO93684.1 SHD1 domain-containing protein [Pirellulaceae bacterium]HMP68426.1 SHD1 domain-containing protein [Pirellulaceae bacterium]